MELRPVRCFVALAEHLHFVHAAELLHMTQPALSQQISLQRVSILSPKIEPPYRTGSLEILASTVSLIAGRLAYIR
jgi:predicted transcriptional regulator